MFSLGPLINIQSLKDTLNDLSIWEDVELGMWVGDFKSS